MFFFRPLAPPPSPLMTKPCTNLNGRKKPTYEDATYHHLSTEAFEGGWGVVADVYCCLAPALCLPLAPPFLSLLQARLDLYLLVSYVVRCEAVVCAAFAGRAGQRVADDDYFNQIPPRSSLTQLCAD